MIGDDALAALQHPHWRKRLRLSSMAETGADRADRFLADAGFDRAPWLDKQYSVWGKVVEGMDVIDTIKRGEPVRDPDSIKTMRVAADL